MVEKASWDPWWQEEAQKDQEVRNEHQCSSGFLLLFRPGLQPQAMQWWYPCSEQLFPLQLTFSGSSLTQKLRGVSARWFQAQQVDSKVNHHKPFQLFLVMGDWPGGNAIGLNNWPWQQREAKFAALTGTESMGKAAGCFAIFLGQLCLEVKVSKDIILPCEWKTKAQFFLDEVSQTHHHTITTTILYNTHSHHHTTQHTHAYIIHATSTTTDNIHTH